MSQPLKVVFSIFTNHTVITTNFRTFSSTHKETLSPLRTISHFPQLLSSWQLLIYFVSMGISYKWNLNKIWSFMSSLFTYHVFKVQPCYGMNQYFIPSYGSVIFHCMKNMPKCVYPFIKWWTFVLFPPLAIMNNTAMNIQVPAFM